MNRGTFFLLFVLLSTLTHSQIRFYTQYKSIPFREGSNNEFSVLTGVKIDPNKEVVVGWGITGNFNPQSLETDISFSKNEMSLGFNYYQTRWLYYNFIVNFNVINEVLTELTSTDPLFEITQNLINKFFFDYEIVITAILARRLHFSVGGSLVSLGGLVKQTAEDFFKGKIIPDLSLALRLYVFQIKI